MNGLVLMNIVVLWLKKVNTLRKLHCVVFVEKKCLLNKMKNVESVLSGI